MSVVKKTINIEHIPAMIWGVPSSKVYLYVHGQDGNKEEAATFAEIVGRYGFQTLSIDLPEHGERKDEKAAQSHLGTDKRTGRESRGEIRRAFQGNI